MTIDFLAVWQKNADGSGLVFSPDHCRPVRLNFSGSIIFESFLSGGDLDVAVAALQARFPSTPAENLRADAVKFQTALIQAGILRESCNNSGN